MARHTAPFNRGERVEQDEPESMFTDPRTKDTEDSITGRFG
ncbi:MAG TPA: hypothetical protein VKA48_07690 [Gammaproteobacteria bacterium]|nr:hypothetical protein [Gammaproteobacteria bacterium]